MQVWVVARDVGGLTGEVAVQVALLAPGDNAPRVAPPPPDLFLPEDAVPGTLIAQLRAPAGPLPRLRLAPTARADERLFTLDDDGRLLLAAPLDRETAQDHIIGEISCHSIKTCHPI